jgi:micrococcal nuclease
MKTIFLCFVCVMALQYSSQAQASVTAADAAKYMGKRITVCDKVYGGRYFEHSDNTPTLLNMGAAYPNNPFTFVIQGENRKKFSYKPEEWLVNKEVCVTGEIIEFKGKPEMLVSDSTQVFIKK